MKQPRTKKNEGNLHAVFLLGELLLELRAAREEARAHRKLVTRQLNHLEHKIMSLKDDVAARLAGMAVAVDGIGTAIDHLKELIAAGGDPDQTMTRADVTALLDDYKTHVDAVAAKTA